MPVRKRMSTVSGLRPCPTGCPLGPAPTACASGRGHAAPHAGRWRGPIARAAPGIRRAPGRQQRARLVLALAPPAGALSARLPLASLDRALRAHKGGGVAASPQLARALRAR